MKKSRRDFLKLMGSYSALGVNASVFNTLVDMLMGDQINKAFGANLGSFQKNSRFVYIQEYAAPERWVFDLFLDPYSSNITPGLKGNSTGTVNHQVVNAYTGDSQRYTGSTYKFVDVKGVKAPYLWGQYVGTPSGRRPLSDLLDHLLSIRGINTGNGVHTISAAQQIQPATGGPTLTGIVADRSDRPISHVAVNPLYSPYRSDEGKARLNLGASVNGGTDLIERLKAPFNNQNLFIDTGDTDNQLYTKINQFEESLASSIAQNKKLDSSAEISLRGAKDVMFDKIDSLIGNYAELKAKYVSIISNTLNIPWAGINDKPVGSTNIAGRGNDYQLNATIIGNSDLRELIPFGNYGSTTATLDYMADIFTLMEFSLINDLTDSIQVRTNPWRNLPYKRQDGSSARMSQTFDAHTWSGMGQILLMSSYYGCLGACLLELTDRLKENNTFDNTVLQLGGEFCRRPRKNGTGSDHAGYATNISLFTGKLNGPKIVGDIRPSTHSNYWGTYGAAAVRSDGRELNLGNVASTVASILNVPSSSPNNSSIVSLSEGNLNVPDSQLAKNKEVA